MSTTKKAPKGRAYLKGFAERIGKLIEADTLRGLARKVGINPMTLSSYEDGGSPRMDIVYEIIDKTGVSPEWLIFGKGPMYLEEVGTPDTLLAPANLEKTVIDLNTVHKAIAHFENKIRKKGTSYTPEQVANTIILLCIITYGNISKQDAKDIMQLVGGV